MNERGPAISVVIPAYKAEAFIARAVRSVLDQPDVRPEIIVVVDGVYDRTAEIAGGFPGVTVLVNDENKGASAARNRGLAEASAPYVLFLDADDYVEGRFLSGLVANAEEQALDLVFGPSCREWPDGRREFVRPMPSRDARRILCESVGGRIMLTTSSALWRKEFLFRIGRWKQDLLLLDDLEVAWRGMLNTQNVGYASTKGRGVYFQHDGPRITSQRTHRSLSSALKVLDWLKSELFARDELNEPVRQALCSRFYLFMVISYTWGHNEIAEEFAIRWRELGGVNHEGTLLHRLACNLIGLRWKQRLSGSRFMSILRGAHHCIGRFASGFQISLQGEDPVVTGGRHAPTTPSSTAS